MLLRDVLIRQRQRQKRRHIVGWWQTVFYAHYVDTSMMIHPWEKNSIYCENCDVPCIDRNKINKTLYRIRYAHSIGCKSRANFMYEQKPIPMQRWDCEWNCVYTSHQSWVVKDRHQQRIKCVRLTFRCDIRFRASFSLSPRRCRRQSHCYRICADMYILCKSFWKLNVNTECDSDVKRQRMWKWMTCCCRKQNVKRISNQIKLIAWWIRTFAQYS